MNIFTDIVESKAFAKNMARSLADQDHWMGWFLLELTSSPPMDWIRQARVTALLRAHLPEGDGSILWFEGSLVAVFKRREEVDVARLEARVKEILEAGEARIVLREIVSERESVERILEKAQGGIALPQSIPANYKRLQTLVPNIEELLKNWHQEKEGRAGRETPRLMVVDDDPMVLRIAQRAFLPKYEIVTASSGAEAIARHLEEKPDIIFLDIGLPDCDGLTVLNYMQQYDQECRIVMFSADDFLKTRVKALACGAKGFLGKPFSLKAFQGQIAQWLEGRTAIH